MKRKLILRPGAAFVAGLGGLVTVVNMAWAQPWQAGGVPPAPYNTWQALAGSADATRLLAAVGSYNSDTISIGGVGLALITSADGGATWVGSSAPGNNWLAVASSADGSRLVAAATVSFSDIWPFWSHLSLSGDGLIYTSTNSGATWVASGAPPDTWSSLASSADGKRLVAAAAMGSSLNEALSFSGDGSIYTSTNAGVDWRRTGAPRNNWNAVACSADGTRLAAFGANGQGRIYLSTDSGDSWFQARAPTNGWMTLAMSADGARLLAAAAGQIYSSEDSGLTWEAMAAPAGQTPAVLALSADGYKIVAGSEGAGVSEGAFSFPYSGPWRLASAPPGEEFSAVACSTDGSKLIAAGLHGVYRSSDFGTRWSATVATNAPPWVTSVASSADGTRLVAGSSSDGSFIGSGRVYVSTNSGVNWSAASDRGDWTFVASSADGTKLAAAPRSGPIFASSDSGRTWAATGSPTNYWTSIALSSDGDQLVASGTGGIYLSRDLGASWFRATTNGRALLATSADRSHLAAANRADGRIYTSANSGVTWLASSAPSNAWSSISCSADGIKLVAVAPNLDTNQKGWISRGWSSVYSSTNSGATWTATQTPAANWNAVTISADGSNIVAVGGGSVGLLRSPPPARALPPPPLLSIGRSGAIQTLSWFVPSTPSSCNRAST